MRASGRPWSSKNILQQCAEHLLQALYSLFGATLFSPLVGTDEKFILQCQAMDVKEFGHTIGMDYAGH